MPYTVAIVHLGMPPLEDGFQTEVVPGTYPTVEAADIAGDAEMKRRKAPVGTMTWAVYDDVGERVR